MDPPLSRALGVLALGAAFLRGILTAPGLVTWITSLRIRGSERAVCRTRSLDYWRFISVVLRILERLAHPIIGRVLSSSRNEPDNEISASRLLAAVTKLTVCAWGLWFLSQVVLPAMHILRCRVICRSKG